MAEDLSFEKPVSGESLKGFAARLADSLLGRFHYSGGNLDERIDYVMAIFSGAWASILFAQWWPSKISISPAESLLYLVFVAFHVIIYIAGIFIFVRLNREIAPKKYNYEESRQKDERFSRSSGRVALYTCLVLFLFVLFEILHTCWYLKLSCNWPADRITLIAAILFPLVVWVILFICWYSLGVLIYSGRGEISGSLKPGEEESADSQDHAIANADIIVNKHITTFDPDRQRTTRRIWHPRSAKH